MGKDIKRARNLICGFKVLALTQMIKLMEKKFDFVISRFTGTELFDQNVGFCGRISMKILMWKALFCVKFSF